MVACCLVKITFIGGESDLSRMQALVIVYGGSVFPQPYGFTLGFINKNTKEYRALHLGLGLASGVARNLSVSTTNCLQDFIPDFLSGYISIAFSAF